jgi:hypothetical protein
MWADLYRSFHQELAEALLPIRRANLDSLPELVTNVYDLANEVAEV